MINKEELEKYAIQLGFNLWQAERDYLQHLVLSSLSRRTADELIFKGGTALQKVFGLNRFSIDLDFTQNKPLPENLFELLQKDISLLGIPALFNATHNQNSIVAKALIHGISYRNTENTAVVLWIEISLREKAVKEAKTTEIYPVYSDLQPYLMKVMDLDEILAEKVRAILTRTKARDIFDLRFLLHKSIHINEAIVNEKLKDYKLKYSKTALMDKIKAVKSIWQNELSQLVAIVPEFDEVVKQVKERL